MSKVKKAADTVKSYLEGLLGAGAVGGAALGSEDAEAGVGFAARQALHAARDILRDRGLRIVKDGDKYGVYDSSGSTLR